MNCDKDGVEKTSQIIEKGGVAVFPTDTVYGIGCNPYNLNSVKKISMPSFPFNLNANIIGKSKQFRMPQVRML